MKKLILLSIVVSLTACGEYAEIPPAHVGMILTKNGYAPDVIPPSRFRLPVCFRYCDELILLQAADIGLKETMKVFMPKDRLNITLDVRGTISIRKDATTVKALFDRVTAGRYEGYDNKLIPVSVVYKTYGEQAVRGIVRSEVTKYSIGEILSNRESMSQTIHEAINKKLEESKTPLVLSRFELADVQPPAVIVEAQESAKKREIDIQKAEANAQVQLVEAEKALQVAKKDRLVEKEKALAIAEQNKIAAESITPQVLEYKRLETALNIMTAVANSNNPGLVVLPVDMQSFVNTSDSAVLSKLLGKELKTK